MVTKEDIERARKYISMYKAAAQKHEVLAKICRPNARGGHRAAVTKNMEDVRRWQETLAAHLGWLAMNDRDVFHEVKDERK